MSNSNRDHSYTVNLANQALGLIRSHRLPGDPPSFEIWYAYASRSIPALNQTINELLATNGTITAAEVERIYDRHLGTFRFGERIEKIGEEVGSEVDQIVGMLDGAIESATRYGHDLSGLGREIERTSDRQRVHTLVDDLVRATRTAADESRNYRTNLTAARSEIRQLHETLEVVRFESRTDPLTALANRKQFDQSLNEATVHAKRTLEPLTLLMCDVDYFKRINDTWGHPFGDDVLRLIAQTTRQVVRSQDIAARYGGDEFAIIFPNTALEQALVVADRLRESIMKKDIIQRSTGKNLGRVTISIGAAQWQSGEEARSLLERADACLYAAKREGRNRVVWQSGTSAIATTKSDTA